MRSIALPKEKVPAGKLVTDAIEECLLYFVCFAAAAPIVYFLARNVRWIGRRGFQSFATASVGVSALLLWGVFKRTSKRGAIGWGAAAMIRLSTIAALVAANACLYHLILKR